MTRPTAALLFLLAVAACEAPETSPPDAADDDDSTSGPEDGVGSPDVRIFGSIQQIFAEGDFSATANLQQEGAGADAIGLGALSGLRGEIAIIEGEAWLGYPDGEDTITVAVANAPDEEAALLVVGDVPQWVTFTIEEQLTYEGLTQVVEDILEAANWPDDGALPFKIEGAIERVDWHVIDGSRLPEGEASHDDYEQASVQGSLVGGSPTLVGFYSTQHAGVITHGGVRLHVHVIDADRGVTGHVEDALIGAGSILSLPAP